MDATRDGTLLLVDDNEAARYGRRRILEHAGFAVVEAASGLAALEAIATCQPALVLLDVNLPDINGFEVCRRIKQQPDTAQVLVLQMSATYVQPSDTARALEGGADGCLTEPIEPAVLVATVRALLRLKEAEEAREQLARRLEAEHELVMAVLQQMPAGVVVAEAPSGKILFINRRAVGFDPSTGIEHVVDTQGRPYTQERWPLTRSLNAGETVTDEEMRIASAEGTDEVFRTTSSPVRDGSGRTIAAVAVTHDVTEQKRAEHERAQALIRERAARAEAEAANRAKDEFLAVVSHELRSPLNALFTWTSLLKGGQLDKDAVARGLDAIERNTRLQAKLIADLLDVSRIVTGKLSLDMRPLRLAPIVEATLDVVGPSAGAKGIALRSSLDGAVVVSADPGRLQQVFSNLVSNAVKFTPPGGTIEVTVAGVDGRAEVTVRDSGAGIEPTFLPHVFDRFRQADASTTRAQGGLGLGLAIVQQLVQLHGGSVRAESAGRNHGSTFSVTLPLVAVPELAVEGDAGTTTTSWAELPTLQGVRVLLVDDDPDTRDSSAAVLARAGAIVQAVASVGEALATLDRWKADVVVSDIAMPGRDGYSLVRQLRGEGSKVPAIALTAHAGEDDRRRGFEAGYDAYLVKPIDPRDFVVAVRRALVDGRG